MTELSTKRSKLDGTRPLRNWTFKDDLGKGKVVQGYMSWFGFSMPLMLGVQRQARLFGVVEGDFGWGVSGINSVVLLNAVKGAVIPMPAEIYDELVQEFYGLDPRTLWVDSVSITKSGKIYRWTDKTGYLVKQMSGKSMQAEVTRLYGLTHLVAVEPNASLELRKQVMAGLQVTARLLKN